jgi:tetratricopeptide (TPR) repeat protein
MPIPGWWRRLLERISGRSVAASNALSRQPVATAPACNAAHRKSTQAGPPDFEHEMAVARDALAERDPKHAAFHLAGALFAEPTDADAIRLLDVAIESAGDDPLVIAPIGKDNWAALMAVRARILHKLGRTDEAIRLLNQVSGVVKVVSYWKWAIGWFDETELPGPISPTTAAGFVSSFISRFPGMVVTDTDGKQTLTEVRRTIDRIAAAFKFDESVRAMHAILVRKIGDPADAIAVAESAMTDTPGYTTAIAAAMAYDRAGQLADAIAMYHKAFNFNDSGDAVRADLAVLYMRTGDYVNCRKWNDQVLAITPSHPTAIPMKLFLAAAANHDLRGLTYLEKFVTDKPGSATARDLLTRLRPFESFLPEPDDAVVNGTRNMLAKHPGQTLTAAKWTLSAVEAPSALLSVALSGKTTLDQMELTVESVATPDPRKPRKPVKYQVWKYDGNRPFPAVAAPPTYVSDEIAKAAHRFFDADAWWNLAGRLAMHLGPAAIPPLLGVLVHPPAVPDGVPAWTWIRHVQTMTTFVLAQIDADPWPTSVRRDLITSLLRGPVDWITTAAITAVIQLARRTTDDAIRRELAALVEEAITEKPDAGHCCYLYAGLVAMERMPFHTPATREPWLRRRFLFESRNES